MKRVFYFLLLAILTLASTTANAKDDSKSQDEVTEVLKHVMYNFQNPNGFSMNYSFNMMGKVMNGEVAMKRDKMYGSHQYGKMWSNGTKAWVYDSTQNTIQEVTVTKDSLQGTNQAFQFVKMLTSITSDSKCSVKEKDGKYVLTVKPGKSSPYKMMKKATFIVDKDTYYPEEIKLKILIVSVKCAITNFKTGGLSDKVFMFNKKDYPTAKLIKK